MKGEDRETESAREKDTRGRGGELERSFPPVDQKKTKKTKTDPKKKKNRAR